MAGVLGPNHLITRFAVATLTGTQVGLDETMPAPTTQGQDTDRSPAAALTAGPAELGATALTAILAGWALV